MENEYADLIKDAYLEGWQDSSSSDLHERNREHAEAGWSFSDAKLSVLVENGWKPINTSPKNSTARLVWVPENKCIYCVSWVSYPERNGWTVFGGGWKDQIQGASHWMPLPEPPKE